MPKVQFSISADGKDVTGNIAPILVSMTITDSEGLQADTLSIVIDDVDGSVEPPRTGAILRAIGGYEGQLRDFGEFSVDNVSYQGWPQTITVSAQSVAMLGLAKQRLVKSFDQKDFETYGDVFKEAAKAAALPLVIASPIANLTNIYEAMTEETPIEFLTRIGEKLNASVTVKSGRLVVMEKGSGVGAGGSTLARIPVTRPGNIISYSVSEKDEPAYKSVTTTYYDREKNERGEVTEEIPLTTLSTPGSEGLGGSIAGAPGAGMLAREAFLNKDDATKAAKSKAKAIARSTRDASFTIDGYPFAQAEAFAEVTGVRSRVNGLWKVKTATHNFSGSGAYTTELSCEAPSP